MDGEQIRPEWAGRDTIEIPRLAELSVRSIHEPVESAHDPLEVDRYRRIQFPHTGRVVFIEAELFDRVLEEWGPPR